MFIVGFAILNVTAIATFSSAVALSLELILLMAISRARGELALEPPYIESSPEPLIYVETFKLGL